MGARFMVLLPTVFVLCASLVFCIYEDQVGLTDWHGEYVGEVKNAVFHTQKPGRKRVIVSTEENVVASLDLRHGKIFWRRVLGTDDRIDDLGVAFGKYVITLSSTRGILRAWNLPDGQMVWESYIHGSSNLMLSIPDKGGLIFVYGGGCLHAVSSAGEVVWMKDLAGKSGGELHLQHVIISSKEDDGMYAVGLGDRSDVLLWKIHSVTGEVLGRRSASFSGQSLSLVSGDTLAALDAARHVLSVVRIGDGEISTQELKMARFIPDFSGGDTVTFPKLAGILCAKSGERTVLMRIPTAEGEPEIVYKTDRHAVLSDVLTYSDSERALAVVEQEGTAILLRILLLRARDFSASAVERIEVDGQSGPVQKVFINDYVRTDRSRGFRALLVMEDHSLLLVQQGEVVWRRHDGLASIVGTTTRDHTGSKKLIIALTRPGRVYAFHAADGHVIWSLSLKSAAHLADRSIHPMNPSTVLVIGRGPSTTLLSSVDIIRGEETAHDTLPFRADHVISLPSASSSTEQHHLHLLIDADGRACLHRPAPDFDSRLPDIYWHSVDTDSGTVRGYGLKRGIDSDTDACFESRELWTVVLDGKIAATAAPDSREVVHTQVKAIADQDAMYKYVSKNVLFVATVADDSSVSSRLVAYVLDTVTGRVIHCASHVGSRGPVHAVFSENWAVYHYFNARASKHEVSVIEIYDDSRAENEDVWRLLVSGNHGLTVPRMSHSHPRVSVKSQSYFFPHSLKSISVTLTSRGVTSKQVLLSTRGDQVVAVDRRYLDAHRSADPVRSEREGTVPLSDSSSAIPITASSYVTHAARVGGLRGVVTFPAELESTVLIFAYGLDLFFTRISPSRTYDSLTPDFSYGLLLVTIAALLVSIAVTFVLSENKDLQDKWR